MAKNQKRGAGDTMAPLKRRALFCTGEPISPLNRPNPEPGQTVGNFAPAGSIRPPAPPEKPDQICRESFSSFFV
jgi:hypothetical protein